VKKRPNPKPTIDDLCAICGRPYAMTHEVFYGNPNAALSQKWGMTVRLCYDHHQHQSTGVHHNKELNIRLKQKYQQLFEDEQGHDKFMETFGTNYL